MFVVGEDVDAAEVSFVVDVNVDVGKFGADTVQSYF